MNQVRQSDSVIFNQVQMVQFIFSFSLVCAEYPLDLEVSHKLEAKNVNFSMTAPMLLEIGDTIEYGTNI